MNARTPAPLEGLQAATAADTLADHVRHRIGGQVRDLIIESHPAGLVLRGRARTYYAKQLAQHAVMDATGTFIISNDIEVE
jgi:hypothetical protein